MSHNTDAEFEHIVYDEGEAPVAPAESDDAKHLREELEPANAAGEHNPGEFPA